MNMSIELHAHKNQITCRFSYRYSGLVHAEGAGVYGCTPFAYIRLRTETPIHRSIPRPIMFQQHHCKYIFVATVYVVYSTYV